jgi:hypothetical protein
MQWSNDSRIVQALLGPRSLASTAAYLKSLTDREVWGACQAAIVAAYPTPQGVRWYSAPDTTVE